MKKNCQQILNMTRLSFRNNSKENSYLHNTKSRHSLPFSMSVRITKETSSFGNERLLTDKMKTKYETHYKGKTIIQNSLIK